MRRKLAQTLAMYAIMAILLAWPILQLAEWYGAKREKADAVELLYQVSLFQMELLGGCLNEAGRAKDTDQLNGLKQAAYSANYAHERLAMALGRESIGKLESVSELLQWVVRLQIGGSRTLKPEELKTLQEAAKLFKPLFEDYGKLTVSGRGFFTSQGEKVKKEDRALAELLIETQLR